MPMRSGLIVLLRIFAIGMLLQIAGYMIAVAATVATQAEISRLPQIAIASFLLVPFLLIFWCSGPIVDFLSPRSTEIIPEGPVTANQLQAVAFSAAGAFILADTKNGRPRIVPALPIISTAMRVPMPRRSERQFLEECLWMAEAEGRHELAELLQARIAANHVHVHL